jgi:hypothetical protein
VSEESLTNAAVEWLRFGMDFLDSVEQPPTGVGVTDVFVFQDGRSGFNFGRIGGAAGFRAWTATSWGLADQQLHFSIREVVSVRGRRSAAVVVNIDDGTA